MCAGQIMAEVESAVRGGDGNVAGRDKKLLPIQEEIKIGINPDGKVKVTNSCRSGWKQLSSRWKSKSAGRY